MGMKILNLGIYSSLPTDGGIDEYTVLIIHANGGDTSGQNHIPAYQGTAQIDATTYKFGKGSLKLDGDSDFLLFPDSADWDIVASNLDNWTIDLWAKHTDHEENEYYITHYVDTTHYWTLYHAHGGFGFQFYVRSDGDLLYTGYAGEITDTNWHHIAVVKVGSKYAIYKDGTQVSYVDDDSTVNFTGNLVIGQKSSVNYFDGNMDGIRIQHSNIFEANPVVGLTDTIDVPTSAPVADDDTKLLLNFEGGDQYGGHNVEPQGTAQIDATTYKFGTGAWKFDGDSDYLELPNSDDWSFGTGAFTIDFWTRFDNVDSGADRIITQAVDGNNRFNIYWGGSADKRVVVQSIVTGLSTLDFSCVFDPSADTWYHIAIVRISNTNEASHKIFINGISKDLTLDGGAWTGAFPALDALLIIGYHNIYGAYHAGHFDEFRISKGIARWTENFTPPTKEYF